MEARNRTLPDWFTRIRTRQMKLPRFQRFEAWSHNQVTALLNNVLQELPTGSVLVMEVGDKEPFVSRPMIGAPAEGEKVVELLLDGQQRLTALWRSLTNHYDDRSYLVSLEQDEETRAPYYVVSYARYPRNGKRYPIWLDDPKQVWARNLMPVHLLRPDNDAEAELEEWATKASDDEPREVIKILQIGNKLRQLFAKFNIPFLSLQSTVEREIALNVFIQMNTSATPLSAYDIVVAQVEAETGLSLHELADDLKQEFPATQSYVAPSDLMLAVGALLQDKVPNKSTYLSPGFSAKLIDDWDQIKAGIGIAINFLEQERVFDDKRLPTDVVMYPVSALWSVAPSGLDAEGEARTVLRKYLWRTFFTERYERTSATRALVDFRQVKALFDGEGDEMPLIFNETEYPLPEIGELLVAGWAVRKDRLPRALLALSLRTGGIDFADGNVASREHLSHREYHHLFPRALLSERFKENEVNRALNCALVTWKTNRNISAKTPSTYLMERLEGSSLGEQEIRHRLQSHLIPYDELFSDDYETFLMARAELMHPIILKLCNGELV